MLNALRQLKPRVHARAGARSLNLALQGGGAHGAFTWGVLDRLLEDGRPRFKAVSGTSAGAMNAVALAAGLMAGGRGAARTKLEELWRAISKLARFNLAGPDGPYKEWSTDNLVLDLLTRVLSPYQFNPLDFNPLGELLNRAVDFKELRDASPVELYISATEVASGSVKVFETGEVSADVVLASACLPHLHHAIEIEGRHYWDGGYSANPALLPLVRRAPASDTLIVQINAMRDPKLPMSARDIIARLNVITFNAPLKREIELIEQVRTLAREGISIGGPLRRRLLRHRFHLIDASTVTGALGQASKLAPDWDMLVLLRDAGREAAAEWLDTDLAAVGRRATVDLATRFL